MSNTYNFEVIYSYTRNDGKPCTKRDLRLITKAQNSYVDGLLDVDTTDTQHKRFGDCLDSILDDAPTLGCGVVTCHACVTLTTDDTDEDATADRIAKGVNLPEVDGYAVEFVTVVPISL